jgi:hypothetical protein
MVLAMKILFSLFVGVMRLIDHCGVDLLSFVAENRQAMSD